MKTDSPESLIHALAAVGARLTLVGDNLALHEADRVPPALVDRIRAAKPALVAWLRLSAAQRPWIHVARQVMAGEFDDGSRSLLGAIFIGVRNIPHSSCRAARARLDNLLGKHRTSRL